MKAVAEKLAVLALSVAGLVSYADAQITNEIEFKTSSSFVAGQATLPAGAYTVKPVVDSPDILEIAGAATGEPSVMVEVVGGTTNLTDKNVQGTQLVFNKFGDKMVLTQIWLRAGGGEAGGTTSYVYQLMPSHAAARAAHNGSASKVLLAAASK